MRKLLLSLVLVLAGFQAHAQDQDEAEFDPFDPNAEQMLQEFDKHIQEETGSAPFLPDLNIFKASTCYRLSCSVYAVVDKRSQTMYLYLNGQQIGQWAVSTGVPGRGTPDFDTHPDGRIYDKYSSKKYPGGNYNGLGNMPYAVFIRGGFAIHGTPKGNWSKLGKQASHGCIRVHPENALVFNRLVRQYGQYNTWITVQ